MHLSAKQLRQLPIGTVIYYWYPYKRSGSCHRRIYSVVIGKRLDNTTGGLTVDGHAINLKVSTLRCHLDADEAAKAIRQHFNKGQSNEVDA